MTFLLLEFCKSSPRVQDIAFQCSDSGLKTFTGEGIPCNLLESCPHFADTMWAPSLLAAFRCPWSSILISTNQHLDFLKAFQQTDNVIFKHFNYCTSNYFMLRKTNKTFYVSYVYFFLHLLFSYPNKNSLRLWNPLRL